MNQLENARVYSQLTYRCHTCIHEIMYCFRFDEITFLIAGKTIHHISGKLFTRGHFDKFWV